MVGANGCGLCVTGLFSYEVYFWAIGSNTDSSAGIVGYYNDAVEA